jgi:hypothetical protein
MENVMKRAALLATILLCALAATTEGTAGDEKKLVGTYRLVERVANGGGAHASPPAVLGTMTFSKTRRTVIMKWAGDDGSPVSIALIATYTLSGGKYCESVEYGAQSNLGAPGISYDTPSATPACSAAISDAVGFAFDVPGEKLRIQITHDGILTTTPRWTDHWERVK